MNKRKTLIITLIILIIITISFIIFLLTQNKVFSQNTTTTIHQNKKEEIFKIEPKEFNHCKNPDDERCKYVNNSLRYITSNKSYPLLDKAIKETNKIVEEKYNEVINSTLDSTECDKVKDIYNYRKIYMMGEFLYETNNIIGIAYEITGIDICTEKRTSPLFNSYIYDVKQNKMLSNDEILKLYNIEEDFITKAISDNISYWNKENSTNYTIKDLNNNYKLYLSREGNLEVFYTLQQENITYTTTVKKQTNN